MAFFGGSGLPRETLSSIWQSTTGGVRPMDQTAFHDALRLASAELASGAGASMPPPATSAPSAASAMPPPAPRLSQSAPSDLLAGITPKDLKKYAAHYAKLPGGKEGEVSVEHAVRFLCKAKLPADAVRDILARTTGGSTVVRKDAFCAAMHETYGALKSRGGATPAPSQMTVTPAAAKPSPSWTPAPPPPPLEPAASGGASDAGFADFGAASGSFGGGADSGGFASFDAAGFDSSFGGATTAPPPPPAPDDFSSGGGFADFGSFGDAPASTDASANAASEPTPAAPSGVTTAAPLPDDAPRAR